MINIQLKYCDSTLSTTCKTKEETDTWLQNKFLYLAYNSQLFNADLYDNETFTQVSVINRVPINLSNIMVTPYNYVPSRLEASDSVWGGVTNYDYYNLNQAASYSFYQDPLMVAGISF